MVKKLDHGKKHGGVVHSLCYHPTKACMLTAVKGTMFLWTAPDMDKS